MKASSLLAALLCGLAARAFAQTEVVFFSFDDDSLPWRENLHLTLEHPTKYAGNPVLTAGPAGTVDTNGALLYGTVIQEGGKYRMWYIAQPQPDPKYPRDTDWPARPVAYAESEDGKHWQKPNLGLVEFCGSRENNIVSIEPKGEPCAVPNDFVSVLHDPDDPDPARRYKMIYIAYLPQARHSTAVRCVSPDGLRWKLASTEEFTEGHFENTSLIKFQGLYYATGQNLGRAGGHLANGQDAGRSMTGFFSPDFMHWSHGRALCFFRSGYEQKPESLGQELHMGAGLWNRGNVVVGINGRWHGDKVDTSPEAKKVSFLYDLQIDLGLVVSNDAIHYREPVPGFVFASPGNDDQWDSKGLLQSQAFANTDTETYIWYSDWYTRNPAKEAPVPGPRVPKPSAIGLLTLRRDGFGYLSKHLTALPEGRSGSFQRKDTKASVLSKPVTLATVSRLVLNADLVSAEAPLQVSLVDDAEQPLAGFAPVTVTKSGVRVPVPLGEHGIQAGLKFRVKVEWPDGAADPHFYALYFQPE